MAAAAMSKEELLCLHYFWQSASGDQMGPSELEELRREWLGKNLHGNCHIYGDGFEDWVTVDSLPILKKIIEPPPPPPPAKRGASATPDPPAAPVVSKASQPTGARKALAATPSPERKAAADRSAAVQKRADRELTRRPSSTQRVGLSGGWVKKLTCDMVPYYLQTSSGQLTWNTPEELRSNLETEDAGAGWVWLQDASEGYVAARGVGGGVYDVSKTGEKRKAKRGELVLPLVHSTLSRLQPDLVLLDSLDEGLVLHNLRERYKQDKIYTAVGGILIALNPFRRLPLYGTERIEAYHRAGNKPMPPHPYKLAHAAHQAILDDDADQAILVSGESGAGKTEATKQCLSFLAEVAGSTSSNIEQRVLSANPILEAFGNAKTTRNDNSSRFGRFTKVQLDSQLRISGAKLFNYLLEKSRVQGQADEERNYHVFYQLCCGSSAACYNVQGAESYDYLNNCLRVPGVDDASEFDDVLGAFNALGFGDDSTGQILAILAAILKLSTVQFEPIGGMTDGSKVSPKSVPAIAEVAMHLGADVATLGEALTHRTLQIRGQKDMAVALRVAQSYENRDALAKYVYDNLFDWLVDRVNAALEAPAGQVKRFIGILDIFGFEIFKINSFEQLCINFANERLQQLFNEHTFKTEASVYANEGVDFPRIEFRDNQPICDLIEKRGGIFTALDDAVKGPGQPEQKDAKFSQTIDGSLKGEYYVTANEHRGVQGLVFSVRHYAGTVCYSCDGFVEKNADTLYKDLYDAMSSSTNSLVSMAFPKIETASKTTLGANFRKQLASLMLKLRETEPHYIRCVKPNQTKSPALFEGGAVLEQLKCAGVFEAVKIRKQGFPFRFEYDRFVVRYKSIMSTNASWEPFKSSDARGQCEEIIKASRQTFERLQRGRTMLLFRADEYRVLELCRALAADRVSAKIQAIGRGKLTRRYLGLITAVRPQLAAAVASRDAGMLEQALRETDEALGVFSTFEVAVPIAEWKEAKRLLTVVREAARLASMLEMAAQPTDEDLHCDDSAFAMLFQAVMRDCQAMSVLCPVEPLFDQWFAYAFSRFDGARTRRFAPKFEMVMHELERDPMAELYAEANKYSYETPFMREIEKLLACDEETLLKRQYVKARETGQESRAREKEIALKEVSHSIGQMANPKRER
ncbi:P-loop containing nucleoside triphosphate hydrolase protein [Pelagophyceae sp. CCMP2097]|nr:P-loop containing nucleoside triphosphate hydrolase protein [Pelagophyceae sp. CCMP2097]